MNILHNEVIPINTKITLVLGALGSGKTTFIRNILPNYPKDTKLIINDIGSINIDSKRIEGDIIPLKQGCICCDDINGLKDVLKSLKGTTSNIVIEPSGIADGSSIQKLLVKMGFEVSTIFLGDVKHHKDRSDIENKIISNQIKIADIIGITWNNSGEEYENFVSFLGNIANKTPIIEIPYREDNSEFINKKEEFFNFLYQRLSQSNKKRILRILQNKTEKVHKVFYTISGETDINFDILKDILSQNSSIIRAKGVIDNKDFDYVHNDLQIGKYNSSNGYITFISLEEIDIILQNNRENNKEKDYNNNTYENYIFEESEEKILLLLEKYKQYNLLEQEISNLQEVIKDNKDNEVFKKINSLQIEQKVLSDSMKYDNPYIWLEYKRLAYIGTQQEIKNIGDLQKHCENPNYICHKRLYFLNNLLKKYYNIDIFDSNLIDINISIEDFMKNGIIQEISKNDDFMKEWLKHEYFEFDGRISKWENFLK